MADLAVESSNRTPCGETKGPTSGTETTAQTSRSFFFEDILRDKTYAALKNHFLMTGKGRRPHLPSVSLNNQVLGQLSLLKEEGSTTWEDVLSWFYKLFPQQKVTQAQLQYRIQRVCAMMGSLHSQELIDFLNIEVDFNTVPEELERIGLDQRILLGDVSQYSAPSDFVPTISVLMSLEAVRSKKSLPFSFVAKWLQAMLKPLTVVATESQIKHKLSKAKKEIRAFKLRKQNEELDSFLQQPVYENTALPKSHETTSHKECVPKNNITHSNSEFKSMKDRIVTLNIKIQGLELQTSVLKEERATLRSENEKLKCISQVSSNLRQANKALNESLATLKASVAYKNNLRLRKKLAEANLKLCQKQDENRNLQSKLDSLNTLIDNLKSQIKCEQTMKSKLKKNLEAERLKSDSLLHTLNKVKCLDNSEKEKLNLRDERFNKFKDSVRLTCMALQGEGNVAASNCSKVIQIVCRNLFDQDLELKELPSTSSALNMMYEGNSIAKYQMVDEIKAAQHFTYASDGTSRQKTHYMERHIVLDNGKAVSMGFSKVSSDSAKNLLEQTLETFDDLIDCYGEDMNVDEREQLLKDIIKKMKCVMSDRAANMKLFNQKLAEWKKDILGGEEDAAIHFLYCNAHFLLGLSAATEDAATAEEKKIKASSANQQLGRDAQAGKFARFASNKESAPCRLIRTATEVLGPRGDEKNGCREEWINYCEMKNINSRFLSYRSNRFNNLFENAHATLYHRHHIHDFLQSKASASNMKLQSIIADLEDNRIMSMVAAISLFNLSVTGPYWKLMNSTLPYGSFPGYVKKIEAALDTFSDNPSLKDVSSIFEDFSTQDGHTIEFINSEECIYHITLSSFKTIAEKCTAVLKRQMKDFLDGGVFSDEIEEDVKKLLDSCPLTNLTGERLFGDLDYDMHKRRRASLHLRSTVNMWKKNGTATWLNKQVQDKKKRILNAAKRNAAVLKLKSKESEKNVKAQIKEKLYENERKRNQMDLKQRQIKADVLDAIIAQGGVCKTQIELESLYKNGTAEDLKMQIRYRKVFHGEKHLRLTGTVQQLYQSLLQEILKDSNETPPLKKGRFEVEDSDKEEESDLETADSEDSFNQVTIDNL